MKNKKSHNSLFIMHSSVKSGGFSLLETLVALAILNVAILGPLSLANVSIRSASLSHNTTIASFLAEEAVEFIRAKRDANIYEGGDWDEDNGLDDCDGGDGCRVDVVNNTITECNGQCPIIQYDNTTGFYQYGAGVNSIFTRSVYIKNESSGGKGLRVTVIVEWQERFLPNKSKIQLESHLFEWH